MSHASYHPLPHSRATLFEGMQPAPISVCFSFRRLLRIWFLLPAIGFAAVAVRANPSGGSVAQGTASFSSAGPVLTIQTSSQAYINWRSFNIGVGETTTFLQPSASSLVWNQINDPNPSQILGTLNANGFVVLQNQAGFYIGGQAALNTGGLIMSTAPIPMPDLSGAGAWQFNAPPPTARIINYGQINVAGGSPAFLIARDIENHGAISAPQGNIGLYAGEEVLVSERPDGRGLTATVTLPEGSVDNSGRLIADAGTIAMRAQVVNQGGLLQANSVREVNGVIELVAGDSLNLGPASVISAKGDAQGTSPGGSITLKSGNEYTDSAGSVMDVSGGAQGGNGGQIEVSAATMNGLRSRLLGGAAPGWKGGSLTLDPDYIDLVAGSSSSGSGSSANDPLLVGVDSFSGFTQISLQASQNIELGTLWNLADAAGPANLSLTAGNNISIDDGAGISAGRNWSLNLSAGPQNLTAKPAAGTGGIYLNGGTFGGSFLQTQNGNITLWAANEVQIQAAPDPGSSSALDNGIRTLSGGSIQVTSQYGDVNTGGNSSGYLFQNTAPYYTVSSSLGGISTAAGGDVNINAGGDVRSYLPLSGNGDPGQDAGTGAFGPQPGNVTINAGGSVFGHFVLANGVGAITAQNDVGGPTVGDNVALSLIKGAWTLNAPNGNIYLQEARNPNGVYNNTRSPRGSTQASPNHLFDYDPQASVTLDAGIRVELLTTPLNLPRSAGAVPVLFPPSLYISAGAGGVYLADQVTLFPSAFGELQITTTGGGSLTGSTVNGNSGTVELLMSDSGSKNYSAASGAGSFSDTDHGPTPLELNNPNPVILNISGGIDNLALVTVKETQITVGGDVVNSAFSGQNLRAGDKTTIDVGGSIINSPSFSSVILPQPPTLVAAQDLPPGLADQFDILLKLAVDPVLASEVVVPANTARALVANYWASLLLFGTANNLTSLTGFAYDGTTGALTFLGQMGQNLINLLSRPTITVVRFANDGYPMVDASGHFVTDTYSWANAGALATLIAESANTSTSVNSGLRIGGPGEFEVNAGAISLGNSYGILSCGALDYSEGGLGRYANLASITPVGADLNITAHGNIEMLTSTMAALGGGNVTIKSTDGEIDLGSADVLFSTRNLPLGAFATGPGNISVSAHGNVNIDSSRIAAYDGGGVSVNSDTGDVDAGAGGATAALVETHFVDPLTMKAEAYTAGVYGSGILAVTLVDPSQVPGAAALPGNILVTAPQGNIYANLGGILQAALNGNISGGPTVTLAAGTLPTTANGNKGYPGNIDLGDSGVIGGTINLSANGNINGLIISRQNSIVNAAQNFTGTVLSGGSATVSAAAGSVSGTIVGVGGASVSGASGVTAQVLGQSVSVNGGAATSTLGTSAAGTSASASAAGTANTEAKDQTQTTGTDTAQQEDELKKKKRPLLTRTVGRVTVILPK